MDTLLLNTMLKNIKNEFPSLKYSIDIDNYCISIPSINNEIGNIDIQDDIDELTIFIGDFTHWHAECYNDKLNKKEKAQYIANEVIEFLKKLFNDEIIMWSSHTQGAGICDKNNKPFKKTWFGFGKERKFWVWSGKLID